MHIARNLYEGKIDYDNTLKDIAYQCTTCGVCEANCGVIENHLKIITKIRKHLMDKDFPESKALFKVADRISKYKNRYGLPRQNGLPGLKKDQKELIIRQPIFFILQDVSPPLTRKLFLRHWMAFYLRWISPIRFPVTSSAVALRYSLVALWSVLKNRPCIILK